MKEEAPVRSGEEQPCRGGVGRVVRRVRGAFIPLVGWCATAILFWLGPSRVGFISTDYDILRTAAGARWFQPLERHHWSPIVHSLFKATQAGLVGRPVWVALAFFGHCANILLVWRILLRWGIGEVEAGLITVLFALCPAGFEALAWSSAVGYVLVTSVILFALRRLLRPRLMDSRKPGWELAALQLLAFAVWDWGILLTPLIAVSLILHLHAPYDKASTLKKALVFLAPAMVCWGLVLAAKAVLGHPLGYSVDVSPLRAAYLLVSAPLRAVYPNGPTPFYRSAIGVAAAVCLIAVVTVRAVADRRIATAASGFVLSQVPYLLLGAPESRYFYVASPFLSAAVILAASLARRRSILAAAGVILVGTHAFWATERAVLWRGAYREAQRVRLAIEERMRSPQDTKVVVNLPDRYGPPDMMWRPFVWRDGLGAISGRIIRVNTPDAPFTWRESGIPVMDRPDILRAYPRHDVMEVVYSAPGQWRSFAVIDLRATTRQARAPRDGGASTQPPMPRSAPRE